MSRDCATALQSGAWRWSETLSPKKKKRGVEQELGEQRRNLCSGDNVVSTLLPKITLYLSPRNGQIPNHPSFLYGTLQLRRCFRFMMTFDFDSYDKPKRWIPSSPTQGLRETE